MANDNYCKEVPNRGGFFEGLKKPKSLTFNDKERLCEKVFENYSPIYHLYTQENHPIIFTKDDDFKVGMNIMALSAFKCPDVKILTFELMSNHIHIIVSGDEWECRSLFEYFRRKLSITEIFPTLIPITDLRMLRNELAYVNRNGYVVNSNLTPYSDIWGAGGYFFNRFCKYMESTPYQILSQKEKRGICKGREIELPETYQLCDGIITPPCYCHIEDAQMVFRDAHHYFNSISKDYEAYSEIAKRLGDRAFVNDNEVFAIVWNYCNRKFGAHHPKDIAMKDKIAVAIMMHYELKASNDQITRILGITRDEIESLFPKAK